MSPLSAVLYALGIGGGSVTLSREAQLHRCLVTSAVTGRAIGGLELGMFLTVGESSVPPSSRVPVGTGARGGVPGNAAPGGDV